MLASIAPGVLVAGLAVGLILGMTGAGGGVLAVPLLIFTLGLTVSAAAPVALLTVAVTAGLGALLGLRTAHVRYRAAALMAVAGFSGAPLGLWLSRRIPNGPLMLAFAALLVHVCVRMLRQAHAVRVGRTAAPARSPVRCVLDPAVGRLHWTLPCARALAGAGLAAGIMSSLLGVGGGFVIVPALMRFTDLDMPSITATSLAVIALVTAGSFAAMLAQGQPVQWATALPFVAAALTGLLAGRQVAVRVSPARLQQGFALAGLTVSALLVLRALSPA
jgi:uncharacterized membrane protein YfcA